MDSCLSRLKIVAIRQAELEGMHPQAGAWGREKFRIANIKARLLDNDLQVGFFYVRPTNMRHKNIGYVITLFISMWL